MSCDARFKQEATALGYSFEGELKILGPAGAHTRTSVGVLQLPKNATVELSLVATVNSST